MSRRSGSLWRLPRRRAGLVIFACLAVLAGVSIGYVLGLLNRPAHERTPVAAVQPEDLSPATTPDDSKTALSRRPQPAPLPTPSEEPRQERADKERRPPPASEVAWIRNSVPSNEQAGHPLIAIVIDDVGLNPRLTRKVAALPAPVTMAFLTYADRLEEQTAAARAAGHELLVHFPMEPLDAKADPGPNALLGELTDPEISERLAWGLSRFEGYVGINNHMGSRFTSAKHQMTIVLRELKARGLLFLDSVTSADSVGAELSRQLGLPYAARDVFLDNSKDRADIRSSLALLEKRARAGGSAIGIGHPFDATIDELATWMEDVRNRGFSLVPLTAIVRRNGAPAQQFGSREQGSAG